MTIRGIVFDKDGVLFDFRATWEVWAEQFLLRATQNDWDRAFVIGKAIGFDLQTKRFERDSVVIAGTLEEIAEALDPYLDAHTDLLSHLSDEALAAPQVETVLLAPLMHTLRMRGLKLGVATNDGIDPARVHLSSVGAEHAFDFVAGYDSGYGGKPAPGQLNAFCAEVGLAPEECVMVGDSLHDMLAGQAAGMATLGVLTGMATEDDLAPHASAVLPDIGHIPGWLDGKSL